jgi:hypothetical protein
LGYWERRSKGEHVYVYVLHREGRHVRRCYLGAEAYDYVERLHNMGLVGMQDEDRFERYAEELLDRLNARQLARLKELIEARLARLQA